MICELCGKDIQNKGFGIHLKYHHKITSKEYYDIYLRKPNEGICPVCGKETTLLGLSGYRTYCSTKCLSNAKEIKQKRIQTNIDRYGVICNLNLEEVKEKAKVNSHTEEIKEKTKQTCLERYGVEYPNQAKIVRDKNKQTCINKYDVEYVLQVPKIREKIKQTNIENYGVDNPWKNKEIIKKLNNTIIKNNGGMGAASQTIRTKMYNSLWKNKSHSFELKIYEELLKKYPNTIHEYKSEKYPFKCDFYIPNKDLYLELNLYWMHGGHWFNKNNQNDLNTLELWKSQKSNTYDYAIKIWTERDILKKKYAEENELNYVVCWTKEEIYDLLKTI